MTRPNPRRSGNPATRAAGSSPRPAGARTAFGGRSRSILLSLSRLPPFAIPGVVLVLMIVGLSAPLAFAVPSLVVVGVFVGWLAYLSWPILTSRGRLLRALMLGLVAGSGIARVLGFL